MWARGSTIVVVQTAGSEGLLIDVADFSRPCCGAHVWWLLPSLHQSLGLAGNPGAWYHRRWQAWSKLCDKLGFHGPHCRRAVVTKHSGADVLEGVGVEAAFFIDFMSESKVFEVISIRNFRPFNSPIN